MLVHNKKWTIITTKITSYSNKKYYMMFYNKFAKYLVTTKITIYFNKNHRSLQ
jgi:hypothetical protein